MEHTGGSAHPLSYVGQQACRLRAVAERAAVQHDVGTRGFQAAQGRDPVRPPGVLRRLGPAVTRGQFPATGEDQLPGTAGHQQLSRRQPQTAGTAGDEVGPFRAQRERAEGTGPHGGFGSHPREPGHLPYPGAPADLGLVHRGAQLPKRAVQSGGQVAPAALDRDGSDGGVLGPDSTHQTRQPGSAHPGVRLPLARHRSGRPAQVHQAQLSRATVVQQSLQEPQTSVLPVGGHPARGVDQVDQTVGARVGGEDVSRRPLSGPVVVELHLVLVGRQGRKPGRFAYDDPVRRVVSGEGLGEGRFRVPADHQNTGGAACVGLQVATGCGIQRRASNCGTGAASGLSVCSLGAAGRPSGSASAIGPCSVVWSKG